MECEVAGTGAGPGPCESIRRKFAGRNIQPVNVNPVDATVGRNQKTAAGIERDIVRVRAGSSLIAVRPDLALRRDHIRVWSERPVWLDREYGDARAIADDDVTVARVRCEVSGVVAARWLLVEKSNPAARLVDCVGADL